MTAPGDYNANVVLTANVGQYQQAMGAAQQSTDATTGSVNKLLGSYGRLKDATRTKFISWDKEAAVTLAGSVAAAGLFEKQLQTLSGTAAVTGRSMGSFRNAVNDAFSKLPVARGDVVALATEINQLGITAPQQIGKLVETFTKLGAVTGAAPGELAQSMLQFTQSMGDQSLTNVRAMSDQLVTLSKNAGVSAQSVLNFANAIAPIARVAGINETAVLGLSTAFSKAGADGYVAGNTFNSLVADISNLTATGSPQLAKYANTLGMTTDQFRKLPTAQAVAQLFDAVNRQGSAGINTLNQWGISGVRAITSIQRVAQSGQLDQLINQSGGANGALNRGASAAMGGLSDELASMRNQFTLYGTYVGQHLIGPTTEFIHVLNNLVKVLGVAKPVLAPLLGVVGLGGQVLGGLSSFASPLMMAMWMRRSPIGRNLAIGWRAGRAGDTEAQMASARAAGLRLNAAGRVVDDQGNVRALSNMMFTAGAVSGRYTQRAIYGESGESQRNLVIRNALMRLPGMGIRGLIEGQRTYLNNASTPGGFEAPLAERVAGQAQQLALMLPRQLRNIVGQGAAMLGNNAIAARILERNALGEQAAAAARITTGLNGQAPVSTLERAAVLAHTTENPEVRARALGVVGRITGAGSFTAAEKEIVNLGRGADESGSRMAKLSAKLTELIQKVEAANTEEGKATGSLAVMRQEILDTAAAMGKLMGTTAVSSVRVIGQTAGGIAGRMGPMLGNGLKNLGRMAINPWMLPLEFGFLSSQVFDRVSAREQDRTDVTGKYLNPIQKYNEQLGIATTNLVSLSNAAQNAASAIAANDPQRVTATTPMSTVTSSVSAPDRLQARLQKKINDTNIQTIYQHGGDTQALTAYAKTLDMTDPRQVQRFKQDAVKAGFGDQQIVAAMTASQTHPKLTAGETAALARVTASTEGNGAFATNPSKTGAMLVDSMQTYYLNQLGANSALAGTPYGAQVLLHSVASGLGAYGGNIKGRTDLPNDPGTGGGYMGAGGVPSSTEAEGNRADIQKKQMAQALQEQFGGDWNKYYSVLKQTDLSKMSQRAREQFIIDKVIPATKQGSEFIKTLTGKDAGGTTNVAKMSHVESVLRMGGMSTQTQAAVKAEGPMGAWALRDRAVQAAAQAPDNFGKQAVAIQRMTQFAFKYGDSFSGAIENLQKIKAGIQDSTSSTYLAADAAQKWIQSLQQGQMATMNRGGQGQQLMGNLNAAFATRNANTPDAMSNFTSAQGGLQEWANSQNDWMIQTRRQAEQYDTQMTRAEQDFYRTRRRARFDFNTQMKQSDDDYTTQRARAYRDFNKQIRRMAEDEAKAAYDPFRRVQTQFTTDAGTLEQNLEDQNTRLARQASELAQARRLGLSKQALQQLDLANPQNAQQLDSIVQGLQQNPHLIDQINRQVARRVHLGGRLARSQYSTTFSRATEDFRQSMADQQKDYEKHRKWAVDAQARSMDRLAKDYKRTIDRSAEDLKTAMTEINTNFADSYGGALAAITGHIQKWAPGAAKVMKDNLHALDPYIKFVQEHPDVAGSQAANSTGGLLPNTMGYNSRHQIGEYDTKGRWHPYKGYVNPSQAAHLGRVYNPLTGHAAGGVSTRAHVANISEDDKAEAIIPLDQRGLRFMTSFYRSVARELVQTMNTAGHPTAVAGYRGTTNIHQDFSTQFTGDIKVTAADYRQLMAELQHKTRLAKLARAGRR